MSDRAIHLAKRMIFIPYALPEGAEARGYAPWLQSVDNPFFNAISGIHHYANWTCERVLSGPPPQWDWFDFKAIRDDADLEAVWFNADLDAFRKKWLELWGYGAAKRADFVRYSYLFELQSSSGVKSSDRAVVSFGSGEAPQGGDLTYRLTGYLPKHFAGSDDSAAGRDKWLLDDVHPNPLGFDWISVAFSDEIAQDASFSIAARQVAAP